MQVLTPHLISRVTMDTVPESLYASVFLYVKWGCDQYENEINLPG